MIDSKQFLFSIENDDLDFYCLNHTYTSTGLAAIFNSYKLDLTFNYTQAYGRICKCDATIVTMETKKSICNLIKIRVDKEEIVRYLCLKGYVYVNINFIDYLHKRDIQNIKVYNQNILDLNVLHIIYAKPHLFNGRTLKELYLTNGDPHLNNELLPLDLNMLAKFYPPLQK